MSQNYYCSSCRLNSRSIYGQFYGECPDCGTLVTNTPHVGDVTEEVAKKKVRILSTLDILISVFAVTPLVVACWRGTWQLMDIYSTYFPFWESFIIGTLIHIVVGISQESFDGLVNRKHKSRLSNAFAFLFMKLYTIIVNGVTNMHWRGGWSIVDEYFEIRVENGRTILGDAKGAFCFFSICFLILFAMRCLRNLNAPPFEICLDYGDDMFLFPNMFKVKLTLFVTVSTCIQPQNIDYPKGPNREKLTQTWIWQEDPKPFKKSTNNFQFPRGFIEKNIVGKTPLLVKTFLHINPHEKAQRGYPRNIQEIIGSMTSSTDMQKNVYVGNISSLKEVNLEIFKDFQPSDPGEVNLLGPASLMFTTGANTHQYSGASDYDWEYQSSIKYLHSRPFAMAMTVYPSRRNHMINRHLDEDYNIFNIE